MVDKIKINIGTEEKPVWVYVHHIVKDSYEKKTTARRSIQRDHDDGQDLTTIIC